MRIVITGMGIVSPLGTGVPVYWDALCRGVSGMRPITRFDTTGFPYSRGGEIDPVPALPAAAGAATDPATMFMLAAAAEAATSAGIDGRSQSCRDMGIVLGTNFGAVQPFEQLAAFATGRGPMPPADTLPELSFQSCADRVAAMLGAAGPRIVLSLSCSSGTASIIQAAGLIRAGQAEIALAGGYDALSRFAWAGLGALRTMTRDELRPFDRRRDGTLFSEGAGALVVESLDHARARGVPILAEYLGGALNNNAFHMTAPDKAGEGMAAAMRDALAEAGRAPETVDHVNAHGTGTKYNDAVETLAIKAVFGSHAPRVPVTSIKSMTGHMMGAAGSAEAIASVLTIRDGRIPPTIHYGEPDPECDLDYVVNTARAGTVRTVVSNSAGIGGNNASIVLSAFEPGGAS